MCTHSDNNISLRLFSIAAFTLLLSHCAQVREPSFHALSERQPYVVLVSPEAGKISGETKEWLLEFSEEVVIPEPESSALVLVQGSWNPEFEKPSDFREALDEGDLQNFPLHLSGGENSKQIRIELEQKLAPGSYYLVVTPQLQSRQGLPFNQQPGKSSSLFVAEFSVAKNEQEQDPQNEEDPKPLMKPEFLRLNELLYDGKNSETNGESFVELYGTPLADVADYVVSFRNGADGNETSRLVIPEGTKIPEDGLLVLADLKTNSESETFVANNDLLFQFDPQNGPDAVVLLDAQGKVLDALTYGEGAVSETEDGLVMIEGNFAKDVSGGHSLSRVEGLDSGNNQADFVDLEIPSPGIL